MRKGVMYYGVQGHNEALTHQINIPARQHSSAALTLRHHFFGREFEHVGPHFLAGLEFYHRPRGNRHIGSGALGLRPTRALRILISKTPKLRSSTLSPLASDSAM